MKYIFLFFGLLFCHIHSAQIHIEKKIEMKIERIYADHFDNFYVIYQNSLIKYNSDGENPIYFQPESREKFSIADLKNPYKVLLFSPQENRLIILDKNLSEINTIFLEEKANVSNDIVITSSMSGGYFIYDNYRNELIKLNAMFEEEYRKELLSVSKIDFVLDLASKMILHSETGELFSYEYSTDSHSKLAMSLKTDYIQTLTDMLIYYSPEKHTLEFSDYQFINLSVINLPDDIEIIDAVFGNKKIFFYDHTYIYIASME